MRSKRYKQWFPQDEIIFNSILILDSEINMIKII